MNQKPKRPPSVWIAQIVIGLYAAMTLFLFLWALYAGFTEGVRNAQGYFMSLVMNATFVVIFAGAFIGLAKGVRWGRWLGVAALSILAIGAAITQTSRRISGGDGSGLLTPYMLFSIVVVVGLALLVYLIAAGDASEHFFNGKPVDPKEPITEPPPPPTFAE